MSDVFFPSLLQQNDAELRRSYYLLRTVKAKVPKKNLEGIKNDFLDFAIDDAIKSLELVITANWDESTKSKPSSSEPHPKYGDLMTVEDWVACVESGGFIDYDGNGDLATATENFNVPIHPSDITRLKLKIPSWATHVIWFNR
jgi:hypothetical protein